MTGGIPHRVASLLICGLTTALFSPLQAADPPKAINAVRISTPPVIDGILSDSCWHAAPAITDFVQFDPVEGAPPTERTAVRLVYDDDALYVGVMCFDSFAPGIVRQLSRRDRSTEADRFTVMVDSYRDQQTGFVFTTNVSGVQGDGIYSQGGSVYDNSWDAVWTVQTRIFREGWTAEFAIPWNALRFARGSYEWGINFRRYISRKKEMLEWVMVSRSERYVIPYWGVIEGIRGIRPPLHLDIAPYVSMSKSMSTGTVSPSFPITKEFRAGCDIKYGLTRNFTLDATINPDFGQVEVDQSVLNLTVFETLFPEKRPFFVEGAPMFSFGTSVDNAPLTLFFTRRIGRQPGGSTGIVPPPGGRVSTNPQVTTILGAAKITGRTPGGLSVAALASATDEEFAAVEASNGAESRLQTEPRGTYNVIRLKQEWNGGSWLGGMATLAAWDQREPVVSGGLDWNLRLPGGSTTVDGYLAGTQTQRSSGVAGKLLFSRLSADHWFPTIAYSFFSRRFAPNDIGFFAQPHDHGGYLQILYRENASQGIFKRYYASFNPDVRWNWEGVRTMADIQAQFIGEFWNVWIVDLTYTRKLQAYDDAERGITGLYRRPAAHAVTASIQTDDRHRISASVSGGYERDALEKISGYVQAGLTIRPLSWLELNPAVSYQNTLREEAWVYPDGTLTDPAVGPDPFSVFGDRDVELMDLSLRGIVTFTRTLSLQFFTQVFLARGKYEKFQRLIPGGDLTPYPYDRHPSYTSHDFNGITTHANVLLRWEYLPGSTLYLVWTQQRADDTGIYTTALTRRLGDVLGLPRQDVIMVKGSYWFSL